jgi:hypothetical protein
MLNESVERHYPAINVGNLEPSLDGPEQRRETAVDGLEEDEEHERISPIGLYSQQGRQPSTGTKFNIDLY